MSTLRQIRRLPNTADADAARIARVQDAADTCGSLLSLRGYELIDTPVIEETELFLRKSGGELSSRLYDFEEPGGLRTSLRPEFTSPVIRHAIETGEAGERVCRYQYFGPVFRYAAPEDGDGPKTRQFNQLGAELIGAPAPWADGEVISMAVDGLDALGLPPVTIALGHVGLLRQLLKKFQLSERASQFLLANAQSIANGELEAVRSQAIKLSLLGDSELGAAAGSDDISQIERVLDRSLGPLGANAGSRTRAEVIARLARKQNVADDPANFERALSMLGELMSVSGSPGTAIDEGRKIATSANLDDRCFLLIEQVVNSAVALSIDESGISIRYGLARGVAYYTGMLFDILPTPNATDSLGGGGRYDGLTRALGLGEDVPALGFAYNLDAVVDLVPETGGDEAQSRPVLVKPADESSWKAAAATAAELRRNGRVAVFDTADEAESGLFQDVIVVDSSGGQSSAGASR